MTGLRMSEEQLLTGVLDALVQGGWRYQHVRRSDRALIQGDPGIPDLTIVHARRRAFAMLELKTATGRLRPGQLPWIEDLTAAGVDARLVRPADYDDLVRWLVGDRLRAMR